MNCYTYNEHCVVLTDKAKHVSPWLGEFFAPWFRETAGPANWNVSFEISPGDFHAARSQVLSHSRETIPCFTLEGRFASHPAAQDTENGRLIYDQQYDVVYRVDTSNRRVDVLDYETRPAARSAVMRVIRELATAQCLADGELHLHGSAIAMGGRALIAVGPRRTGKTTFMLRLLREAKADFLSNDRLLVNAVRQEVRGMPTVIRLRSAMLKSMPWLMNRFRFQPHSWRETLDENGCNVSQRELRIAKAEANGLSLTSAQFCELTGTRPKRQAKLAAIIFPEPTGNADMQFHALSRKQAHEWLYASILRSSTPLSHAEAFRTPDLASPASEAELREQCAALVASVPCFTCRLGVSLGKAELQMDAILRDAA